MTVANGVGMAMGAKPGADVFESLAEDATEAAALANRFEAETASN